jgi:hypothetical protein
MIGSLQTWQWAASDESRPLREVITTTSAVSQLARLRKNWSPEQIAVITELAIARTKAFAKFPDQAACLFADRDGVEMASSARSAAHKAARFAAALGPGAKILDACCGIGGDTMALAHADLAVTAIDLDERRAWMAGTNAGCPHLAADIRMHATGDAAIHIDPARRSGGNRTRTPDDFEPPFDDIIRIARRAPMAAIKLNPGVHAEMLPPGELEIISERGTLTQAVLWTGNSAANERRATLLATDGTTHTIAGPPDRAFDSNPIQTWIHTMDPSLERAELVPELLSRTGLLPVHPGTGLLTSHARSESAWTTSYRVMAELVWTPRTVKAALRDLDAGLVTVKTRAGAVNPDQVSRQLRGNGTRELVVFVMPIDGRVRAMITERPVPDTKAAPHRTC